MTQKLHRTYVADWAAIREKHSTMTPEEAQAWIRKVMGPPKRTLEGTEREHVWLILQLTEPTSTSNNQHSWTEEYYVGDKYYDVHYFPNEDPIIEEILPD